MLLALFLALFVGVSKPVSGQELVVRELTSPDSDLAPISMTIDDAVQIALTRSYTLRRNDLDLQDANWQVKEVFGSAYPQMSFNSNYRRNIVTPNPFAGSDAGGFFSSLTSINWLAYNETQRLDDDPLTGPLTLEEYRTLRSQGVEDAGITLNPSSNPFQIDNQWNNVLVIDQVIYDGAVFSAIKGQGSSAISVRRALRVKCSSS